MFLAALLLANMGNSKQSTTFPEVQQADRNADTQRRAPASHGRDVSSKAGLQGCKRGLMESRKGREPNGKSRLPPVDIGGSSIQTLPCGCNNMRSELRGESTTHCRVRG